MAKAKKLKQLNFTMPNRVGLLSEVTSAMAGAKVNISTITAYEMENKAYFMLATDGNAKAKKALAKLGVDTTEDEVIAVEMPNKVGELQKVAKKIADAGINIVYMYGTTGTAKSPVCLFKTSDNTKTARIINRK
jgi:hypothetical protein